MQTFLINKNKKKGIVMYFFVPLASFLTAITECVKTKLFHVKNASGSLHNL